MNNRIVGVCLGASTVSFVEVHKSEGKPKIKKILSLEHQGDPKNVFHRSLAEFNTEFLPVVVTGRKFRELVKFTNISESQATEYAFSQLEDTFGYSAIASLGGETFMVYTLDKSGKISNVITKNQCASGTGEFFLQQIKRMDVNISDNLDFAQDSNPFKVSGRCSVFCKSDCTHALNKGIPKGEVTAGLAQMMAEKVTELLKKVEAGKVLVIGGVTKNSLVMKFMQEHRNDIIVPESAPYFEALGAAVYGLENQVNEFKDFDEVFLSKASSFVFHEPLEKFKHKVDFKESERGIAQEGDICILGLDVGSTTTKAVIVRKSDKKILASIYLYTHGNPINAAKKCYLELLNQIKCNIRIIGLGTTGSGRHIAGLHALTDGIINEIVAHATAAIYFDPEVETIFEIGGQDAKYTYIVNKVPADYAMNEACSAGTGSFIEESAYESLKIKVTDIEPIAMKGQTPPNFSDQCSAFISSDIKTALQENISREDVVAGLVYSVCLNYVNRVKGNRPVGTKIFMQGGVCYNKAIPIAMAALTGQKIIIPPDPGLMGAFGVALEVSEKIDLGFIKEKEFDLIELSQREVNYKKPFVCAGGREKCDLKCSINMIEVQGKKYPFGGACNKYYNLLSNRIVSAEKYDFVKIRHDMTFKEFAPENNQGKYTKTIGINQSFHTHTLYPLYHNFFTKLGFKVVLSDDTDEEGLEREMTSFCYPAQVSLGQFQNLIKKNPDYYFIPNLQELHVSDEDHYRIDYSATCVFVITEPYYLKQAFKEFDIEKRILAPSLNLASGLEQGKNEFIIVGKILGHNSDKEIAEAFDYAVSMQLAYQKKLFEVGAEFMRFLKDNPDEIAIVLVGRPYNSFTDFTNKGIPQKFASRGIYVIPYDMFDYRDEVIDDNMYWEGGKKILKIASLIKKHPQLFATYITNFSCGPDSMIMTTFRGIMDTKPSLTLELDGHTADAGINTRIDAALDIIQNYRKISHRIKDSDFSDFNQAKIEFDKDNIFFITSENEKLNLKDKRIRILIPSMGDLSAKFFASTFRSLGFNAEALPEGNSEMLKYGRSATSGKECLPLILCVGGMLDYIENQWDGEEYLAFFNVQSAGNCRLGQYPVFMRDLIKRRRLKNVAVLVLQSDDGYAGLGIKFSTRGMQALLASDVMDDIRSAIMANAVNPDKGLEVFNEEFDKVVDDFSVNPGRIYQRLEEFSEKIKNTIPARIPIHESKYIALCGEIYVRRDHFSHKWLNKQFAKKGFVLKDAYISEWIKYIDYLLKIKLLEPDASLRNHVERFMRDFYIEYAERKIKKILEKSGYYEFQLTEIKPILEHSEHLLPIEVKGEIGLTIGTALYEGLEFYSGIINLGPFGCMPTRVSEAIMIPEMNIEGKKRAKLNIKSQDHMPKIFNGHTNIPFLTIETDGNVYPQVIEARLETFTLQADRIAKMITSARKSGEISHKKESFFNKLKVLKRN